MKQYDLIIIGGGSAGFNAARVATEQGMKTAVIDGAKELGGLCILRGCMPSKTLLYAADVLHHAKVGKKFGLTIPKASANMKAVHARKREIIGDFASHRQKQIKNAKFDLHQHRAHFIDDHTVELSNGTKLRANKFLIGTGSSISTPNIPGLRDAKFWTSDEVLNLDFIPKSVIVLGGGIVACELAQFLNRIGSRVILIQRSQHILRDHSTEAAKVIEQAFSDEGIELFTGTELREVKRTSQGFSVKFKHQGKLVSRRSAHGFNALGRSPNTANLQLDAAGVKTRSSGQIITNRWQQTSAQHIYAAGDCSGPHEIVHVAIQQGELAARHAHGLRKLKPVNYDLLLGVVFTDPQLATIGKTESQLKTENNPYLVESYPFDDHGKSILMEAKYGYVKVFADPIKGRILGAEIVGKDAGELIHCFTTPLAMRATVFDMLRAPWYHPTLAEIITYPLEDIAERISPS